MTKLPKISRIAALFSLSALLFVQSAGAQTGTSNSDTSVGLEVTNPLYEFTIQPGTNVQEIIKIKNVGAKATVYYPEVLDFKSNNEDGTPLFLNKGEDSGTYSLAKWINFTEESFTLEPGRSEAFNFNVTVPADAEPGGHYAGILFSTQAPETSGTGLSLATKVGALVLVRVAGDANEGANIKEFTTDKTNYETAKVEFDLLIGNSGNVHVQPKGTITVKNFLGGTVAALDVNQTGSNVLPGSDRRFNISWDDPGFKLGYYTATAVLTYGTTSQTMTEQTSFWIIPWKTLLVALGVLIVLIIILVVAIKRYNAWIISKASKTPPAA